LPIGTEEHFRGIVDLVTMKALVWDDESLGARWREDEIPADMKDASMRRARSCSRLSPTSTSTCSRST
jgi:translation elongation factor EF-G